MNKYVPEKAADALRKLAKDFGVSQSDILSRLIHHNGRDAAQQLAGAHEALRKTIAPKRAGGGR